MYCQFRSLNRSRSLFKQGLRISLRHRLGAGTVQSPEKTIANHTCANNRRASGLFIGKDGGIPILHGA